MVLAAPICDYSRLRMFLQKSSMLFLIDDSFHALAPRVNRNDKLARIQAGTLVTAKY